VRGLNVETKARSDDLDALAVRGAQAGAVFEARLDQVDTYFTVGRGRLKLREIVEHRPDGTVTSAAELIRYERPDESSARLSEYDRTWIADPAGCRAALEEEHAVRSVVRKQRDLWQLGSTRIHLDRVEGAGTFVELETVVGEGALEAAHAEHERVLQLLRIEAADTIGVSYVDLAEGEASDR
jgi:adenylate cyclase class IV